MKHFCGEKLYKLVGVPFLFILQDEPVAVSVFSSAYSSSALGMYFLCISVKEVGKLKFLIDEMAIKRALMFYLGT